MSNLLFREESYAIIGACIEVYKQKGCGFTEAIYQDCLAIEFQLRGIPFVSQPVIELEYKGRALDKFFRLDFLCFEKLVVEIKALPKILPVNRSQAINYLCATSYELALLVNFGGHPRLEHERILNGRNSANRVATSDLTEST